MKWNEKSDYQWNKLLFYFGGYCVREKKEFVVLKQTRNRNKRTFD